MSTGNTDEIQTQRQRDTCLSHRATQALDIWTLRDGEGQDRSEPRASGPEGMGRDQTDQSQGRAGVQEES